MAYKLEQARGQPAVQFLSIHPTRMPSRALHGQVQHFTFMYPNKEDYVVLPFIRSQ